MLKINYKGNEKTIHNPHLHHVYERANRIENNDILMNDIHSVLFEHNEIQMKKTWERLESAFRTATCNGNYDAFELELECKGRQY